MISALSALRLRIIFGQWGMWVPCGPCSEIFYDHGDAVAGGPPGSADEDGDRFIEIWNLVFMQYEQRAKDDRVALPSPSIDTGMGMSASPPSSKASTIITTLTSCSISCGVGGMCWGGGGWRPPHRPPRHC